MTATELVRGTLAFLGTYALHSTAFLGAVWALCALRPPRSLRLRERLWKLALVGGIASAALQLSLVSDPWLGSIDWKTRPAERGQLRLAQGELESEHSGEQPSSAGSALDSPRGERPSAPSRRGQTRVYTVRPPTRAGDGRVLPSVLPSTGSPSDTNGSRPHGAPAGAASLLPAASDRELREQGAPAAGEREGIASLPATAPEASSAEPRPSPLSRVRERTRDWPGLLLLSWCALLVLGLGGLLSSWSLLRRTLLGRRMLRSGPLFELLEELRTRAGLVRPVRLSVSRELASPLSLGLFRPEICVPAAALRGLERTQQEAMLAHELAHVLRRDPAWFGLYFLLEKLFFFQPLNRVARGQLVELAEVACDDWAVRWTGARLALASCLTEVAQWILGVRRGVLAPGLANSRSRLGQRIERLLDDRRSPAAEPPASWWPALAAGSLGLAVLAAPGISAGAAASARPALSQEPPARRTPGVASAPVAASLESTSAQPLADAPAAPPGSDFQVQHELLLEELALLEAEAQALRAELSGTPLSERFSAALEAIETRLQTLRLQHARVSALLEQLEPDSTPPPPALDER